MQVFMKIVKIFPASAMQVEGCDGPVIIYYKQNYYMGIQQQSNQLALTMLAV